MNSDFWAWLGPVSPLVYLTIFATAALVVVVPALLATARRRRRERLAVIEEEKAFAGRFVDAIVAEGGLRADAISTGSIRAE
jgi:hypothetical protein